LKNGDTILTEAPPCGTIPVPGAFQVLNRRN
jgi:hypothetical protein